MDIRVGIQNSKLITDNKALLSKLSEVYTVSVPGASFSELYKKRLWDGKKRFFYRDGRFKTGLLEDLLERLKRVEIEPNLVLKYKEKPINNLLT